MFGRLLHLLSTYGSLFSLLFSTVSIYRNSQQQDFYDNTTTQPLYNWYFIEKLQWHVTDLWNTFLTFLPIFLLYLELNCNQFEFWIFFLYSNLLLWRFFYLLHCDKVQFHFPIIKILTKNVSYQMHFMTILSNFLMQFQHKYIYYSWGNYFCRSSHLYFKIVLSLSQ